MDTAKQVGTITYNGTSYPLFNVQVNLQEYDAISIVKESGTITVNGAETKYPTGIQANNSGTVGLVPDREVPYDQENVVFDAAKSCYQDNKASITLDDGESISESGTCLLFRLQIGSGRRKTNCAFLAVSWGNFGGTEYDTKVLEELLTSVSDENANNNYYTSNDRYDGKQYSTISFWAEFTKKDGARDQAQKVLNNPVNQNAINAAVKDLEAAISKLISKKDYANTTLLYEAMQHTVDKDRYTPMSYAAYTKAYDEASALMAQMFDSDGNPTEANKPDKQQTLEALAEKLEAAWKNLDERVSYNGKDGETRVKLMASALEELNRRFSAPGALDGYTAESIAALQSALKTANETLAETPVYSAIGQLEAGRLTDAVRAARAAAAGLETQSQKRIHVKLSALDAYDVYMGRTDMWWALHNKNILTTELELPANASAASVLREKNLLKRTLNESKYDPSLLVFRNGELLNTTSMFTYNDIGVEGGVFESLKLHDGDELTLVWICGKQIMYSSTAGYYTQYLYEIPEYFRYSTIEAPAEVVAGEAFEVTVTSDAALPFLATGEKTPVVGATIRRSATEADAETVSTNYVHRDTYQTTDENGKATLTLYNEGYVLMSARLCWCMCCRPTIWNRSSFSSAKSSTKSTTTRTIPKASSRQKTGGL